MMRCSPETPNTDSASYLVTDLDKLFTQMLLSLTQRCQRKTEWRVRGRKGAEIRGGYTLCLLVVLYLSNGTMPEVDLPV